LDRLTVRLATVADAPAIGACHNACWRQAYRGLLSAELLAAQDDAARADMWHGALSESVGQTVVVAEMGDRIVGLAAAGKSGDEPAVRDRALYALYILESTYGTGVGQRLFDAAVGVERCSLWVAEANARAIAFYRRQGFRPDGARKRIEEWEGLPIIRMLR
jgi:ribosomal protein S18 acetylase RimI-like enzyme